MPAANRLIIALTLGMLASTLVPLADAEPRVRIVDTEPSGTATLGRGESFYVRLEYATDESITLWARPYLHGTEVRTAMSNASAKFMGSGEALGWFALTEPGEVDEIRIIAGGGTPYRQRELTRLPVNLRWTASTSTPSPADTPAWVDALKQDSAARMHEGGPGRVPAAPAGPAGVASAAGLASIVTGFTLLMVMLVLAGIGVPLWSVWTWRGAWRIGASIPSAVVLFVVLRVIVDTARDPTSHNLWPFEILMAAAGALAAIGMLGVARRILHADLVRPETRPFR